MSGAAKTPDLALRCGTAAAAAPVWGAARTTRVRAPGKEGPVRGRDRPNPGPISTRSRRRRSGSVGRGRCPAPAEAADARSSWIPAGDREHSKRVAGPRSRLPSGDCYVRASQRPTDPTETRPQRGPICGGPKFARGARFGAAVKLWIALPRLGLRRFWALNFTAQRARNR